jgi:hypothetical protein
MTIDLKVDKDRPHHYIIGVAIHPATSNNAGKMYLKYRPVYFHNDDVEKVQHAIMLSRDKLFKTTGVEAVKATDCEKLVGTLSSLKLAAAANMCTLHHFSSEHKMDITDFEILINGAERLESTKELLKKSAIRG